MKHIHTFRIEDEAFDLLVKQAEREHRSQAGQIEYLVQQEDSRHPILTDGVNLCINCGNGKVIKAVNGKFPDTPLCPVCGYMTMNFRLNDIKSKLTFQPGGSVLSEKKNKAYLEQKKKASE